MRSALVTALIAGSAPAALAAPTEEKRTVTTAAAYASSSDGVYKLSSWQAPVQGTGSPGSYSTWSFTVNDGSSGYKQTVKGFGAAVTDATVAVFNDLSSSSLSTLLNTLLTTSGADFSLFRHTIAASDLSAAPAYTYDDNNGNVDTSLSSFNLGDRGTAMAQLMAKMKSVNSGISFLGSPWSPPGWMKLNGVITGTTTNNNINENYYSEWAQYFIDYIKAYASLGATIDQITIQNEPLNSQSTYPTCYIYDYEAGPFIQNNLGPALKSAGLATQVWAYDHNTDQPGYPETVVADASAYVGGVAWHCYANPLDWSVLTSFHNSYPNVPQYMTECWTSPQTSWDWAANFTMGPLQNWAEGAMAWTLGTDTNYGPHFTGGCSTCRGLVVVDTSSDTYSFAIDYYMMAQFSKYIPKGAIILSGTGSYTYADDTGLESVASLNPDGSRTVVFLNKFANDVYITVTMSGSGQTWSGLVYSLSTTTWVLPPS
ncbi:glycoside hydrolase family 30 protein [Xylariaceae sp. FL0255]|nr:glycoside hydrolase family 30 protein [Xylariaceae sp. FL0255]